ncbi:MAG: IS110 family transposase [Pontiella sp.]|nr:IS110 family transposase [Pontiella sp.]MBT8045815.1 IS110 family transposase [Pontiella sp.]
MNMNIVYVGIDVSKCHLDVDPFDGGSARVENNVKGIRSLVLRFKQSDDQIVVCCEATGGYEDPLCQALLEAEVGVARINAARVREFARSQGILAKTDRIDAQVLSEYGRINHPRLLASQPEWLQAARALMNRRGELIAMRKQEKARLDPVPPKEIVRFIKQHIRSLDRQLVTVEEHLDALLGCHDELAHRFRRLTAVQAVGRISALSLIVYMPELGSVSGNQAAALAGLAPYNRDSGNQRGRRMIRGGRPRVRESLYMSAVVSITHNPVYKKMYEHLIGQGKPAKVALTAIMRKMVVLANRLLADPDFQVSC